jgi:hypothetical protein
VRLPPQVQPGRVHGPDDFRARQEAMRVAVPHDADHGTVDQADGAALYELTPVLPGQVGQDGRDARPVS